MVGRTDLHVMHPVLTLSFRRSGSPVLMLMSRPPYTHSSLHAAATTQYAQPS
jgi:hypothetical protein